MKKEVIEELKESRKGKIGIALWLNEPLWHCEKPIVFPDHYYWCGGKCGFN